MQDSHKEIWNNYFKNFKLQNSVEFKHTNDYKLIKHLWQNKKMTNGKMVETECKEMQQDYEKRDYEKMQN